MLQKNRKSSFPVYLRHSQRVCDLINTGLFWSYMSYTRFCTLAFRTSLLIIQKVLPDPSWRKQQTTKPSYASSSAVPLLMSAHALYGLVRAKTNLPKNIAAIRREPRKKYTCRLEQSKSSLRTQTDIATLSRSKEKYSLFPKDSTGGW